MKFDLTIKDAGTEDVMKVLSLFGKTVETISVNTSKAEDTEEDDVVSNESVEGQYDADGLPWDERIHSSSKKLTAKGIWARRKRITDVEYDNIKAELQGRNIVPAQAQPIPVTVQEPTITQAPQEQQQQVAPMNFTSVPNGGAIPNFGAPVQTFQQQVPEKEYSFQEFLGKCNELFGSGIISNDYFPYLASKIGVGALTDIAARPDLIKYAISIMKSEGKWQ